MRNWLRYVVGFVLAYGIFLLVTVPADFVYARYKDRLAALPQPVKLYDLEGTAWSGRAGVITIGAHRLEGVSWQLHWLPLMAARLEANVAWQGQVSSGRGVIGRSFSGKDLYAQELEARLPAALVASLLMSSPLQLDGVVMLNLRQMRLHERLVQEASGAVAWQNAGVISPGPVQLGDLEAILEPDGGKTKISLHDRGGPLRAEGRLVLSPAGDYDFIGSFGVRDYGQTTLYQVLMLLGNPSVDGNVAVSSSGKMRPLGG